MTCDIIIPIWNQFEFTRDCIESIIRSTSYPFRLILIDNGSTDGTGQYLESLKSRDSLNVELIRNTENLGFVKAVNQGFKISKAPYVCILNNDTIAACGWLERMVDFAQAHKDAGLINPRCNGHLDTPIETYARMLATYKGQYMEVNQCQGFCMLIKRELIDKIGYLDEAFVIGGFDDTDYSMRAHMAGYKSVCIYDAYVYHRMHATFNESGNRESLVKKNRQTYYEKWGKHLRVGFIISLDSLDIETISNIILFAYGLAREWTWVHIWLNSKQKKDSMKGYIDDCLKKNALPPHQNIRLDYFNLPGLLFDVTISGKILERMRKRMRDKRFDCLIASDGQCGISLPIVSSAIGLDIFKKPFSLRGFDWHEEGRQMAGNIKARRKHNEGRTMQHNNTGI